MFKNIFSKFIHRKKKITTSTITLQQAIDLKKQLYDEIKQIENEISNTTSPKEIVEQLELLTLKEEKYSEVSLKILETNIKSKNYDNIKTREILVRRRNILTGLSSLPTLKLPKKFNLENVIKQISNVTRKLEQMNLKTFIQITT